MLPGVPLALISDPTWSSMFVLGLLAGILALDDTAFAQTWIGQPLPTAVLTGFLCGDPLTGLAVGLPLQLVLAGNLPVGQTFTGDPTSATLAAVAGTLLSGNKLPADLTSGQASAWHLLGWVILAAGLLSVLGHFLVQAERRGNGLWMLQGLHSLRDGRLDRIEQIHLRCLAICFGRGFGSGILFTLFVLKVWLPLFAHLPPFFQTALGTLPLLLPGLGIGTLVDRYGVKSSWRWVTVGMVGTFLLARYVV